MRGWAGFGQPIPPPMITLLIIWNVGLTAFVMGLMFRQNSMQRQLNVIHIDRLREGMAVQDNQPNPGG